VVRLYLIRHAEAEGNIDETFQGMIDRNVTAKGYRQLECLAQRMRAVPLTALYTSPLIRARVTAEAINRFHRLPVQEMSELREIHAGPWEGEKWAVLPEKFPESYRLWTQDMPRFTIEGGESMESVYTRMKSTVGKIAAENPDGTVAIVSHGCALRNYLSYLMCGSIEGLKDVGWSDNTAVSLVEFEEDKLPKLIYRNDASHLLPELSTLAGSQWCRHSR
jgi:broad specificity phosphatase PhoE